MKKWIDGNCKMIIFFGIFIIISTFIAFALQKNKEILFFDIKNSFFDDSSTLVQVESNHGNSYKISCKEKWLKGKNFVENSVVNYPVIEFLDKDVNQEKSKKINKLFYETALLNFDNDLGKEGVAAYSNNYYITLANEKWICIYYMQTTASGMGRAENFEDAVTISLETGERISLEEFGDIDNILNKINNYKGNIVRNDPGFGKDDWKEHKKEFIEEWKEGQDRCYYGYYLFEGRLGILFDYYRTGRVRIAFEFEDIIDY